MRHLKTKSVANLPGRSSGRRESSDITGRHSNLGDSQVRIGEWWTWYTPIRTALERPFNFRIYLGKTHEYQRISIKARQLRAKGLSWSEIGRKLKVTGKTAKKAAITPGH